MPRRLASCALFLTLLLSAFRGVAFAQDSVTDPSSAVDEQAVARIRASLESQEPLDLSRAKLRFYVQVVAPNRTFADYLAGSDFSFAITRIMAPGSILLGGGGSGGGLDLGHLFRQMQDAYRRREARQIGARIDEELRALAEINKHVDE